MNAIRRKPITAVARVLSALVASLAAIGAVWFWLAVWQGGWDWGAGIGSIVLTLVAVDFGVIGAVLGEWPMTAYFGGI